MIPRRRAHQGCRRAATTALARAFAGLRLSSGRHELGDQFTFSCCGRPQQQQQQQQQLEDTMFDTQRIAAGDHLEFTKDGIPLYAGQPGLLEEYIARCWDVYYGRMGQPTLMAATPIHLRSGCRGVVYEQVKTLTATELITMRPASDGQPATVDEGGMKLFIETVKKSLEKEAPVQEAEQFDRCFYDVKCWRAHGESMQAYIVRRNSEFKKLHTVIEGGCEIPAQPQAHMLLKFSGLRPEQRNNILSSVGNVVDKDKFEKALRMQHATIHETEARETKPNYHPRRTPIPRKRGGAFIAAEAGDDDGPTDDEQAAHGVDDARQNYEAFMTAVAEAELEEEEDDEFEAFVAECLGDQDLATLGDEEMQALAAAYQGKKQFKTARKFSKGGGRGGSSGSGNHAPAPSPPARGDWGFRGTLSFQERKKKERAAKITLLKQKSRCNDCNLFGHWAGDPQCAKAPKGAKKPTKPPSATFVLSQPGDQNDAATGATESSAFVIGKRKGKRS